MHQRIYDIYRQRIHRMLGNENRNIYPQSIPLKAVFAKTKDPVPFAERLKLKYSDIPWGEIKGMRNIIAHNYIKTDEMLIWEAVSRKIEPLRQRLLQIKEELQKTE